MSRALVASGSHRGLRRLAVAVLAAALVLGLAGAGLAAAVHQAAVRPAYQKDSLLTLLVIGSDLGPPHRPANPLRGRADGVHLLAIDGNAKRVTIVSFPRDSLIGGTKVNAHLARGGPERLRGVLQEYAGVPIDFWILATFRSIEQLVDGLGGVDVVIDQRMNDPFSGSDLVPGPQRLPGWQALAYVRDRKSFGEGDVARSRNHGKLMSFTHAQIHASDPDLPELVRLVGLLARNTVSNIPPTELLPLALLALQIDPAQVRHVTLNGAVGMTGGGASIIRLNVGDTFDRIRAGQVGP